MFFQVLSQFKTTLFDILFSEMHFIEGGEKKFAIIMKSASIQKIEKQHAERGLAIQIDTDKYKLNVSSSGFVYFSNIEMAHFYTDICFPNLHL